MTTLNLTQEPGRNEAGVKMLEDMIQTSSEQKQTDKE